MKKKRMQMSHENARLADRAELLDRDPLIHAVPQRSCVVSGVLQREAHDDDEVEKGDDEGGDRGHQREDHHEAWGLLDVVDYGHDPYGCRCCRRLSFQCARRNYPQRNYPHIEYCRCQL